MAFVCECGFRAELSAQQRQRLAASGGRAKCPKCGKICTVSELERDVATDASPELATASPTSIEDALGINLDGPSQPFDKREKSTNAATNSAAPASMQGNRLAYLSLGCSCLLFLWCVVLTAKLSATNSYVDRTTASTARALEAVVKLETPKPSGSLASGDKARFDAVNCDVLKCQTIGVYDKNDKIRVLMTTDDEGTARIDVADAATKERLSLLVFEDGRAIYRATDTDGAPRSVFGVGKNGEGTLVIFDGDGKPKHLLMAK